MQKLSRPIKTPVVRNALGSYEVPEGYRYVPEITRVRNGKPEIIREHFRLLRPVKQRMSLKRRAEELMKMAALGEIAPASQAMIVSNLYRARLISKVRSEINRVLDGLEVE